MQKWLQKWLAKYSFWGIFLNAGIFFHYAARKYEILTNASDLNIYTFPVL